MAAKKKRINLISPPGPFRYPKISEPDYGNDEYPKPNGEFILPLVWRRDSDEAQAMIDTLTPYHDKAVERGHELFEKLKPAAKKRLKELSVNPLYTELYDADENPTGEIQFVFRRTASGEIKKGKRAGEKWSTTIPIFDSNLKPIPSELPVWGGSVGMVSYSIDEEGYFVEGTGLAGLKLHLEGVQILDLVTKGMRSASSLGFAAAEGGFDVSEHDLPTDEKPADDSGEAHVDASDEDDDHLDF